MQRYDARRFCADLNSRLAAVGALAAGLFLALASSTASSAEVTLTWTAPTQNEDGTPLTDLAGYNIYYGCSASGDYPQTLSVPDPNATSVVVTGLPNATECYFVATAYNVPGEESQYSGEATVTTQPAAPNPPTDLSVQPGNLTAYGLQQTPDVITLFAVGTVPEGSACDGTMSVNGHYRVDRDLVEYPQSVTVRPAVIFALCGDGS